MMFEPTFRRLLVIFLCLMILSVPVLVCAAGPPNGDDGEDASADALREQSIYIPYKKLREVFEREGRGVFLPYEQFQELWRAARESRSKPPQEGVPFKAMIAEVQSDATIARDVVRVRALARIELLTEGWHKIPLRLGNAAITSATIGEQPARIVTGDGGHQLLLEKKGKDPESVELLLEYAKAFTKSPGQNSVSFEAPRAPVTRWRVRIPEPGVKINIHPLIAATQVPEGATDQAQPNETVVLAFVGAAPSVRIDWTPRAEGATGLKALVTAQTDQRVWIHEGVVRSRTNLAYDISRATVDQLILEVPADQKVVNVFDANIRQWSVEQTEQVQRLTLDLFEPAQGSQNVVVELERFNDGDSRREVQVPVVNAVDVGRQQGVVAVAVADGLRAEPIRRSGLLQMDASELPESRNAEADSVNWVLSYRYVSLPFDLALRVEKIEPRIIADTLVEVRLKPEHLSIHFQTVYEIDKAGVFRLELDIPAGYGVMRPYGRAAGGVKPVVVESYYRTGDDRTHLVVNLGKQARGRVGLAVTLQKRLDEPDLLSPTGRAAEIAIGIPRVSGDTVECETGRVIVYAPESLRVSPVVTEGLRSISLDKALEGMTSAVNRGQPNDRSAGSGQAFAFARDPVSLTVKAERRKPHITARQFLVSRIEAGVVKYEATFFYDILYSGVESLRIDVPTEPAGRIHNDTPGVRETVIDPPPEDLADDYVAWKLRGQTEFKGQTTITLSWETKIDSLDIGKSTDIGVPRLKPMGVDRAWGQIVLAKAETIGIHATGGADHPVPAGLRPIDPRHDLMPGAKPLDTDGAARAFEFHDDWALVVTATRFKLEEVKRTSIERAVVRTVVTRGDQVSAQALYRVRSARQRLSVKLPEGVEFDNDPVRINGRPVALERGQKDEFFVPLVGQSADRPFVLEIRYTVSGGGTRLVCPAFPSEPAIQKVYLSAYLPPEWVFLGSIGPWTDELRWRFGDVFCLKSFPRRHDADLVTWVTEGVSIVGNPTKTFQTDGKHYLFSTLRPPPPPRGELALVTIDSDLLSVLVFAGVVIGGLILLRTGASTRFVATGAFFAALVLSGVFLPTFSMQIINGVLISAVFVVALVWLVTYLAWVRPRDPDVIAYKKTRQDVRLARLWAKVPQTAPAHIPEPAEESRPPADEQTRGSDQGKGGEQDA